MNGRPELGSGVDVFLSRLLDRDPARRGTPLDALRALESLHFAGGAAGPSGVP